MNSKLNPNAQAWVAALRSGEYQQGQDFLHNEEENSFCCLGVACDLFIKSGNTIAIKSAYKKGFNDTRKSARVTVYGDRSDVPVEPVVEWLGLKTDCGIFNAGKDSLTELNDNGKTFAEIADIIESAPKGLFVEVAE